MFNKLKNKLSGFKQNFSSKIEDKATPVEESSATEPEAAAEGGRFEEKEAVTGTKDENKTGFAHKAKALVFEREFILDEADVEDILWELEMSLLESDIAISVSEKIVTDVKQELVGSRKKIGGNTSKIVEDALKKSINDVMSANVFDFDEFIDNHEKPVNIVFVGINGTGKTTSIAKIAHRLKAMNKSVVIAAGDTFRAGAIDQIAVHAERIGVKLIKHQEGGDPAAVVYDAVQYAKAHDSDVVLSDTAGRMHTNVNLMAQLQKICRVNAPDLVLFVDEAVAGNDAVERADQFNEAVPVDGSILTKTDADSKGGAAISIAYITGKPIVFLGLGQEYEDLKKFDPHWFVDQIFS
ncbi:signal recognition particle-docking protein FtsY [Methanohalophilus euhalobius]|uniref:Signal recognition particle receptor FtsY n=1 Tax=Methanohalophilus euhalobius TaxID=51203 RepID=A0A315A2Q6_9EURY|nr:signal recognition particle-docking protein FtsY [Methanohalophilus euhalobius]PQV43394.1 signal recognition particle-docking protein FtsY [Methanohalophilus euhalobius]RNI07548.1 signal recognition particle-docking protein FtsY [Methanohalophilus euhalobius]